VHEGSSGHPESNKGTKMSEYKYEVSVILNCHAEQPEWIKRAIMSVKKQIDAPTFEIILVADKPSPQVRAYIENTRETGADRVLMVDFGDLGESRNHGFQQALGRYCCTLDCDDLYGPMWLHDAYAYARKYADERKAANLDPHNFVLHPETMVMFGVDSYFHKCIGDDAPEFDAKDLLQWNEWAASCFAHRDTFLKTPYRRAGNGFGYEDFMFHAETFGAGVSHRVVPGTCYAVRMKRDNTSMAFRYVQDHLMIPRMPLYDRRDLPNAARALPAQGEELPIPKSVHQSCLFLHHEVGEKLLFVEKDTPVRCYPRQTYFEDQAALRDLIGDAKHVVLVNDLSKGGAEKYAIDWAEATGSIIVETNAGQRPSAWVEAARSRGIRVEQYRPRDHLSSKEILDAMKRALVQCELDSLFVCNSPLGWAAIHENAQVLAKRVLAANFAPIPTELGFSRWPAIFIKKLAPNLTIITDNEQQKARMLDFNPLAQVRVIHPRATYSGPSKLSRIEKSRKRILWAGRGTPEKRPNLLPAIAAACESWADIHVWGQVAPMNGPESLKYRGPFDGFENIGGSYDCYLMTSIFEGCPNTAMEAVLADLPVVGPDVGTLSQLGRVYRKSDPLAIAAILKEECEGGASLERKDLVREWAERFRGAALSAVHG
jgi:glycosyltransferase involved in cell wall biosynthesis